METRIRQFRRMRGWTLQQLAGKIGTTPQTVQRLETANMTVSMDWLERFACAFDVHPADLIAAQGAREVPYLGLVGRDGLLRETGMSDDGRETVVLDIPADHPVAVRIDDPVGAYGRGVVLIANKLTGADMAGAIGRDALVCLDTGRVLLRRVIMGAKQGFTLVPLDPGGDIRYDQKISWAARLVMRIDYL